MESIGVVTPNGLEECRSMGWLVAPNGRRAFLFWDKPEKPESRERYEPYFSQLEKVLPLLEQVVVYLDSTWWEWVLARVACVPRKKLVLLTCTCRLDAKEKSIGAAGLDDVPLLLVDCEGREGVRMVLHTFFEEGRIPCQSELVF